MKIIDIIYAITCMLFTIIVGAAVYEHLAVWPRAFQAPPMSLTMFQGEFGLNSEPFWIPIHPTVLLFFATSLILNWKNERRKTIAISLGIYLAILISTMIYFVPELIDITRTPFSDQVDLDLTKRASLWEALSIIRMIVAMGTSVFLYLGLTKK